LGLVKLAYKFKYACSVLTTQMYTLPAGPFSFLIHSWHSLWSSPYDAGCLGSTSASSLMHFWWRRILFVSFQCSRL